MDSYDRLLDGFRKFRKEYLSDANAEWRHKARTPKAPK